MDSMVCFANTYPVDSILSSGKRKSLFKQRGLGGQMQSVQEDYNVCVLGSGEGSLVLICPGNT